MKYTLAEQIRRRNQERARQDAAAQKRTRSIPAVIYTSFDIRKADELRERIEKAEEYRERVREAAGNSDKPKQNQKSQKTDSSRQAAQSKTPSYDPLSSIQAPRPKPAPASARKETSDIGKTEDAASVQAALPDIEDVQDNYGADDPSPERMYAYSNLDLLRVRQDMERRLLTFRLCFEQAQSPREALDFLYAESLDCNNSQLTNLLEQQISSRMGDGGDDANGSDDLDIHHSAFKYEDHLESVYGYEIKWASGRDTNRLKQLHNLAQASTHIVNYLSQEVFDGDEAQALSVFQQHFSQSEAYGQLMVRLGADAGAGGPAYGRVPLQGSADMYLGSAVDIPTIVHEFGHVIDRSKGIKNSYDTFVSSWREWLAGVGLPLNSLIWQHAIEGFAGKQSLDREVWADLFMTAVLSPSNSGISKPYEVYSIIDDRLEEFAELGGASFYECSERGGCAWRPVEWRSKGKHGEKAEEHFPMLLRELLSG